MAILYIFSGLPGTGKSTIAQYLSRSLHCAYVRIDTIEQSLRNLCDMEVYDEGYLLAHLIAADNLDQGVSVIADSCNPIALTRLAWQQVAIDAHARFVNIEIICSDEEEHRYRVENRVASVDGLELPSWDKVKTREYHKWSEKRIVIDTACKTPRQCLGELINNITATKDSAPTVGHGKPRA